MKSKAGKIFGGFTNVSWKSLDAGEYRTDNEAFIFSIDRLQVYGVKNAANAVA